MREILSGLIGVAFAALSKWVEGLKEGNIEAISFA